MQRQDGKKLNIRALVFCALIMTATAASDALRGVFLPLFGERFELSESRSSMIIMFSYVGNLLFLIVGGRLSDRLPRKRFLVGLTVLWAAALTLHVLTENYYVLLAVIMFTMGGSTMISTSVNLITPLLFASPAFFVNFFNFCQGAGITASQNIGGRFADSMRCWHIANLIILIIAAAALVLLFTLKLPEEDRSAPKQAPYREIFRNPMTVPLVLVTGCYFVAEHGLQNWLVSYGSSELGLEVSRAAFFLSLFFGALTVGRLAFAPLVQKLGIRRSLLIFPISAAALFAAGMLLKGSGLWVLGASGLAFSVIYPTMVLFISSCYDGSVSGSATGLVLSAATLFDIGFNALFGRAVESFGYARSILLLPAAMVLFALGMAGAVCSSGNKH